MYLSFPLFRLVSGNLGRWVWAQTLRIHKFFTKTGPGPWLRGDSALGRPCNKLHSAICIVLLSEFASQNVWLQQATGRPWPGGYLIHVKEGPDSTGRPVSTIADCRQKNKLGLDFFKRLLCKRGWMSRERPDQTVAQSWGKGSPGSHCVECGQASPATSLHPPPP